MLHSETHVCTTHTQRDIALSLSISLSLYSLQCWGMSLGYSVIYTLHKWGKIMENSKIRIKTNASKREFQVSGPCSILLHLVILLLLLLLFLLLPHAKQTPSEHLGKTFEIQTALKYFSPFVLFNLPNKSDDDDDEENFLPLRHDKTSPRKDEPEKEAEQDRRTDRQVDRAHNRQTDSQASALKTFCSFSPALGFPKHSPG